MKTDLVFMTVLLFLMIGSLVHSAALSQTPDPLNGKALYADVVKFSEFGDHQTGNKGDMGTSKWIMEELKKAGLKAELRSWKLNQFFLKDCELKMDGKPVESFPGWYPNTNRSKGSSPFSILLIPTI